MLGWKLSLPAAFRASCHLFFIARPPSIMASEDPTVAVPITFPSLGALQRSATDRHESVSKGLVWVPELTHRNATIMNERCSRVFVHIDDILIDVLHDELISIFWHPSVHKTIHFISTNTLQKDFTVHPPSEVQQRVSIERRLVMQQLVRGH